MNKKKKKNYMNLSISRKIVNPKTDISAIWGPKTNNPFDTVTG